MWRQKAIITNLTGKVGNTIFPLIIFIEKEKELYWRDYALTQELELMPSKAVWSCNAHKTPGYDANDGICFKFTSKASHVIADRR